MARKQSLGTSLALVAIALIAFWIRSRGAEDAAGPVAGSGAPAAEVRGDAVEGTIDALFAARRSGVWVEGSGRVQKVLSDDNEGSRHQRFILALPSGRTVLVAHNIDLAPRVPLAAGDAIGFRGEYEWNDRGGVVHWTHHDPGGGKPGGHLSLEGKTYR